jgi:hypothetical protein
MRRARRGRPTGVEVWIFSEADAGACVPTEARIRAQRTWNDGRDGARPYRFLKIRLLNMADQGRPLGAEALRLESREGRDIFFDYADLRVRL